MKAIDIKDINYIAFTLGVEYKNDTGSKIALKIGRTWLYGIGSYVYHFFYYLFNGAWKYPFNNNHFDSLYFGISINNENALNNIRAYDRTYFCVLNKRKYPFIKAYLKSLLHVGDFVRVIKNSSTYDKEIIKANFLDFILAYGNYGVCLEIIKQIQPKIVIIANDHSIENSCLIRACLDENVRVLYVQHASVTTNFPPLRVDYAFLDGKESYEKYFCIGQIFSTCFITGAVRFDGIKTKALSSSLQVVGVAINQFDSIKKIESLVIKLKNNGYRVVLRPHPAMDLLYYQDFCLRLDLGFSNPRQEKSYDFLLRIDCLISNQSSIHLDASIVHCDSVCYNMSDSSVEDYYGYTSKGLIKNFDDLDDLICALKSNSIKNSNNTDIVRYYNASTGTKYEGKIGLLIADFINDYVNKGQYDDFVNKYNLNYDSVNNKYEYSPVAFCENEINN